MWSRLRSIVLPASQRRTLDELTEDLDLDHGDVGANRSGFWTMLTLSAVIATAGVLADSTATVIGAMIIAPLSKPIMGTALGLVKGRIGRSLLTAVLGALLVVGIGALFAQLIVGPFGVTTNSQISGRTSPGVYDLVAAVATGFAGAIAQARRDLSAVLPGVAIAISLVPPLAVVGVTLSLGDWRLALGALLLFGSNFVALVLTGTAVFAALGYAGDSLRGGRRHGATTRRTRVILATSAVVVFLPLLLNTGVVVMTHVAEDRVRGAAERWLADTESAAVTGVSVVPGRVHLTVQAPGDLPSGSLLLAALRGTVPDGFEVFLTTSVGGQATVGQTGQTVGP